MAEQTAKLDEKSVQHPEFNTAELIKPRHRPPSWKLMVPLWISLVAIRRGFSKDVLFYRGLTIALIVGIVIGYVVGKFV